MVQSDAVTQPLAIVHYEKLLPGSQVVNLLQDNNYRVQSEPDPIKLPSTAQEASPLIVIVDLSANTKVVCEAIDQIRKNPATRHLPIIAFATNPTPELQESATKAGATLIVSDNAILHHLPECLEQALQF